MERDLRNLFHRYGRFNGRFNGRFTFIAAALGVSLVVWLAGCGGGGTVSSVSFPTTTTITSAGGTVTSGNATLTVSGGVVQSPTTVSVQAATGYPADSRIVSNTAYNFNANGATFVQPVTISIKYTTASLPTGAVESSLTLFKVVNNAWTQVTSSTLDTTNKVVSGTDTTLGVYAILATVINSTSSTGGSTPSVLFTSDRTAAYTTPNLYTINADGTGIRQLTNLLQGQSVSSGFFKPDGTLIVFTEQISGGSYLYSINPDGTGLKALLGGDFRPDGTLTHNHDAEFSSDGTKVVFASDRTGEDEVYIMNPDGTGVTALTQKFATSDQIGPVSFTKAGLIAFTYTLNGTVTHYLISTTGTNLTQVSAGSLSLLPWWSYSPFGANIVYAQATNSAYDIYVAKSDGTGATKITSLAATAIRKARYSNDGTRILFDASLSGGKPDVYAVKPDGTGLLDLTNNAANDLFMDAH
jgi:TolB protein